MRTKKLEIPSGMGLADFLRRELQASALSITPVSSNEILMQSNSIISIHVLINDKQKEISYDLYSTRWSRRITVQQLNGFEFMDAQAEEQLLKENAGGVAEDALLALDLVRMWGEKNGYEVSEVAPDLERLFPQRAETNVSAKKSTGSKK